MSATPFENFSPMSSIPGFRDPTPTESDGVPGLPPRMASTVSRFDGRHSILLDRDGPPGCAELRASYRAVLQSHRLEWVEQHRFVRCLGSGGQGVVFLAERQGSDGFSLPVALKVFSPERYENLADYEQGMARMARVAQKVATIQQDNLLDVHNFFTLNGIRLKQMEWIDGYDLQRLLTTEMMELARERLSNEQWSWLTDVIVTPGPEQPRLKPGIAIAVLRDCLAALAALHRQGIVHADVKPSNIMLKLSGNAKMIDIGAAFENGDPAPRTVCTPAYAAPEVLEGHLASPKSDLASLGYVLLEMLSGARPFAGINDRNEMVDAKHLIARRLRESLPRDITGSDILMNLIQGLVEPNPELRFPSAEAADLVEKGAASFQRQLVKGDLASEYDVEIQHWLSLVKPEP